MYHIIFVLNSYFLSVFGRKWFITINRFFYLKPVKRTEKCEPIPIFVIFPLHVLALDLLALCHLLYFFINLLTALVDLKKKEDISVFKVDTQRIKVF